MECIFPGSKSYNKKESPPVIDVFNKHKKLLLLSKVEKGCRIENLWLNFCKENRLNPSSTKFLYDGQRIHEDDSPNSLEMVNGDTIEVFHEMRGGGRPLKKNIFGDAIKIQNILDSVSDCEEKSDSAFYENEDDGEQRQSMDLSMESST